MKKRNLSDAQAENSFGSSLKRKATYAALSITWVIAKKAVRRFVISNLFLPRKYNTSTEELQFLKEGQSFAFQSHGQKLAAWKWGAVGPIILVLHGWNGRGIQLMPIIRELLSWGFSVMTFDAPGHGDSEGIKSSYFQFTDALRVFLQDDRWKIDGVVAHSLGGAAVINALDKDHQSLVPILIASPLYFKELLFDAFDFHGVPSFIYKALMKEYEKKYKYSLEKDNPYALLSGIEQEIIMIHDVEDPVVPYIGIKEAAEKQNKIRLITTNGLGHKALLHDRFVIDKIAEILRRRLMESTVA